MAYGYTYPGYSPSGNLIYITVPYSPEYILSEANERYQSAITDIKNSIANYRSDNKNQFWGSLLDMEQQVKSGDMVLATESTEKKKIGSWMECSKNTAKTVTLTHAFEAAKFIPIPDMQFQILKFSAEQKKNANPVRYRGAFFQDINALGFQEWRNININGGTPVGAPQNFDARGEAILNIPACEAGYEFALVINSDISDEMINQLVESYRSVADTCAGWLQKTWDNELNPAWEEWAKNPNLDVVQAVSHIVTGMLSQIMALYDTVKMIWDWITNCNLDALSKYISAEGLQELQKQIENGTKQISDTLMMLSDEVLIYIVGKSLLHFISLLTPQLIVDTIGEAFGQILIMVILNLILPAGIMTYLVDGLDNLSGFATTSDIPKI